jgi:hypothetical protein
MIASRVVTCIAAAAATLVPLIVSGDTQPAARLAPARAARLKAAGLDPADAQLGAKLAALAARRAGAFRATARSRPFSFKTVKAAYLARFNPSASLRSGIRLAPGTGGASAAPAISAADPLKPGWWQAVQGRNLTGKSVTVTVSSQWCTVTVGDYSDNPTQIAFQTPEFSFGDNAVHPATIYATLDGTRTNAFQTTYQDVFGNWGPQSMVAADVPHLSNDDGLSLTEGTSVLYSTPGPRISTDPFATQGGSGEDVLGRGVFVVNGWHVSAQILSAQSYMDAPGYATPADSNRGATITVAPQNGRMETHVRWFYQPGESISYTVQWSFNGPLGLRPLSTMPKQSTECDHEQ